ncbi:MAG: peptidylprolyl isomerase [Thermoanaerobaculia bacterium]
MRSTDDSSRAGRHGAVSLALGVVILATGCASDKAPSRTESPAAAPLFARSSVGEVRALLLYLADQKRYEAVALEALLDGSVVTREMLAVALGRIGDPRGRSMLQGLLVDEAPTVRRAAAFALGELEGSDASGALLRAAVDDDPETGALAVEALGKQKAALGVVRRVLTALEPEEADRRLAPYLFRFPGDGFVTAAQALLESPARDVRIGAAYALGRVPVPEALGLLRGLAADPEPRIRAMAARGLGEVGDVADLARLRPLLDDRNESVRIQSLRAGARILGRIEALPPLDWGPALLARFEESSPGVRATAIESSVPWLASQEVRAAVVRFFAAGEPREQELALLALARSPADAGEMPGRVAAWADDPARLRRTRAAEAAGLIGDRESLERLSHDPEAMVRVAALTARLALLETLQPEATEEVARLSREFLVDPDPTVRATLLDALAERPGLDVRELEKAWENAAGDRLLDARLAAIRALVARGQAATGEMQAVIAALDRATRARDGLERREAARGMAALGAVPPAVGPFETGLQRADYGLVVDQTDRPRFVELVTERGTLELRLDCPQAPLTCVSFLKLASQGYFEGLTFHRVVPDFVVQGGDPRGDGWGGPGYALRDEINRLRYDRGALGMALSGPDSGGSQFFLTLSPQPHLDGGYTVFGHLTGGEAVLDRIRQGDRLLEVREVSKNE